MNSSPKKNFYIALALGSVFIVVLFFTLKFFLGKVQDSYVELNALYDSKENYQQANQYLEKVMQESSLAEITQQELNKSFIEKNKEVEFIIKLEQIAEKTSNLIDISIGSLPSLSKDKKVKQEENILIFNVNLAGSFPNLMKFIDEMDSLLYFTDIISLNVQRINQTVSLGDNSLIKQDNIEGNVKTSMIIKTYTK